MLLALSVTTFDLCFLSLEVAILDCFIVGTLRSFTVLDFPLKPVVIGVWTFTTEAGLCLELTWVSVAYFGGILLCSICRFWTMLWLRSGEGWTTLLLFLLPFIAVFSGYEEMIIRVKWKARSKSYRFMFLYQWEFRV